MKIVSETDFLGSKPISTPIEPNHELARAHDIFYAHPDKYHRLIGKLIYLTITRPDLTYIIHVLAQFTQTPRMKHWDLALCVLSFLKDNPSQGILLQADFSLALIAYCDYDWVNCPSTRRL